MARKNKQSFLDLDLSIAELAKKMRPTARQASNTNARSCSQRMSHNPDSALNPRGNSGHQLCGCCSGSPVRWTCVHDRSGDPLCTAVGATPAVTWNVDYANPANDTRQFCKSRGCNYVGNRNYTHGLLDELLTTNPDGTAIPSPSPSPSPAITTTPSPAPSR